MQLDLFRDAPPPPTPWQHRHSADMRARVLAAVAHATASQVAEDMGLTTNMVLGLVHRARRRGVEVRTYMPRPRPVSAEIVVPLRRPEPTPRPPVVGTPMPVVETPAALPSLAVAPGYGPVDLLQAGPRHCRAVTGESDGMGNVSCCGLDTVGRGSWCPAHRAQFRRPAKPA